MVFGLRGRDRDSQKTILFSLETQGHLEEFEKKPSPRCRPSPSESPPHPTHSKAMTELQIRIPYLIQIPFCKRYYILGSLWGDDWKILFHVALS